MGFNFNKNSFGEFTKQNDGRAVLYKNIPCDTLTPILAYLKISKEKEFENHNFLFESAEKAKNKSRFSVIGLDPDLLWKVKGGKSFINRAFNKNPDDFESEGGDVIGNLRKLIQESEINWENLSYNSKELPAICSGIFWLHELRHGPLNGKYWQQ